MWKLSKIAERENKEFCIVWIHKNSGRVSLLYETLILFVLLVCSWILFTSEEGHRGVLEISKRSPVLWTLHGLCITKNRHKYLSQYSVSMKKGCQWCSSEKNNNGMHTTTRRKQGNGPARELSYLTLTARVRISDQSCKSSNPMAQACLWMTGTLKSTNKWKDKVSGQWQLSTNVFL